MYILRGTMWWKFLFYGAKGKDNNKLHVGQGVSHLFEIKTESGFCVCSHNSFLLRPLQSCIYSHLMLENVSLLKIILPQEHMAQSVGHQTVNTPNNTQIPRWKLPWEGELLFEKWPWTPRKPYSLCLELTVWLATWMEVQLRGQLSVTLHQG